MSNVLCICVIVTILFFWFFPVLVDCFGGLVEDLIELFEEAFKNKIEDWKALFRKDNEK